MKLFLALAVCGALTVPALAVAQDQATQPAAATTEQAVKAEKPKKICKSEADAIASRLGTKKICRTQAEWDAIEGRKTPKSNAG